MVKIIQIKKWLAILARQADGSTDTLESGFEQVYQPVAPQVTQLWYKKLDNTAIPKPYSSYFPYQDWDSGFHWDAFGDDLVH